MSGSGLPPLFKTAPKTGVPTGNIGMPMPTTSALDQLLLQKGNYGDAGAISQGFTPQQLKMIPRIPTGGLLNNQSSSYFTPPRMTQAPKTGLFDNFGSNLMNNNLFMLGAALSDRSKPFAQNFANFQNNMLQRQLLGRQLQQQDFANRLALADLGIKQATAGIGTKKPMTLKHKTDGTSMTVFADNKLGFVTASGQKLDADFLKDYEIFTPPTTKISTAKSPATIRAELDLAGMRQDLETKGKFKQTLQEQGLKRIETRVHQPAETARLLANNIANINEVLAKDGVEDVGSGLFKLGAGVQKFFGLGDERVTADEIAESLRTQYAPLMRVPGSGATTDYEMKLYLSAFPSLAMTPDGRKTLQETSEVFAKRAEALSTAVYEYQTKFNKNPDATDLRKLRAMVREKIQISDEHKGRLGIDDEENYFVDNYGITALGI
tara:strand:+ start:332 stop:1639 length:1308 start_codon:yes stop_codon:yes gene_type:complete